MMMMIYIVLPVAPSGMEVKNHELFLEGYVPTSNVRAQVVQPS